MMSISYLHVGHKHPTYSLWVFASDPAPDLVVCCGLGVEEEAGLLADLLDRQCCRPGSSNKLKKKLDTINRTLYKSPNIPLFL